MSSHPFRFAPLPVIAAVLASVAPCPLDANPVQTTDLSGTWGFDPDNGPATTITVPGGGWYKQGFTTTNEADYSKTITIPDLGQPQVTKLKFGAVNYQAELFVDGTSIATSTQSHTAATFDLTGHVTPGSTHDIRLHVKGHGALLNSSNQSLVPNGARSWADFLPQGIFRSAELLVYPQVHIDDVFVKTSVENTSLSYDVWLRNASDSTADVTLSGNLTSWNGDAWSYPALPSQPVSIPANSTTKVTVGPVDWSLGSTSWWWPNVPYQDGYTAKLHDLNLSISGGGSHSTSVRFGFRECTQGPDGKGNTCYFLNGIRVNFRGDSLQGANYDRIDNGGQGDAFSTHPGFLPGTDGWPKAVRNFQRLNYNVVRIHQIPATPYMLDVCDELGLMIIDETAIRGAGNQQDFVGGHDHMVQHLKDLFTQNRNHASIVRQSISNEPDWSATNTDQFQIDLYNAAMEVDGTRPLSLDSGASPFNALAYPNFAVFPHYGEGNNKWGKYTDEVYERPDRPYGSGEFIWDKDNTRQGFAWFATATQEMRAKGASDIRPYTLLSAWASVIPGVETSQMQLENPPWNSAAYWPLYGEDNLPDPWANSQIQRVRAGFNPVLVVDADYWKANKLSNSNGDWPANVPTLQPGAETTRTLRIYNDTFHGTEVEVTWELRQDSATGPVTASGTIPAEVPLGYTAAEEITFTTPDAPDGTDLFLVLSSKKDGVGLYLETRQRFVILRRTKLAGTAFGATPPYSPDTGFANATDGDPSTYFDFHQPDGGHAGIDLGAGNARRITSIVFTPRTGFEERMVGGVFQVSNDGSDYKTVHQVTDTPSPGTSVLVQTYQAYRYLRYLGPAGSYGNIAEMAFFTGDGVPLAGTAFGTGPAWAAGFEFDKAADGDATTFFDHAEADGAHVGIDLGDGNQRIIGSIIYTPRASVNTVDAFEARMVGGRFQGSNDGVNYTTLHTIEAAPPPPGERISTTVFPKNATAWRFLRYLAPDGSHGNIAEMAFVPSNASPLQSWRMRNFGTTRDADMASSSANPDHDPLANVWEYFHGTDPRLPDPAPVQPAVAGNRLTLLFDRNTEATDLTAVVQAADSPQGAWTDLASSIQGASFTVMAAGASVSESGSGVIRSVTIGDVHEISDPPHPRRFMRLMLAEGM